MKMLMKKRLIMLTCFIVFLLAGSLFIQNINIHQVSAEPSETESVKLVEDKKMYSEITIEDDFADDVVLVVLNRAATMRFREYTPKNFPELDLVGVTELTKETSDLVQRQMNAEKTRNWKGFESRIKKNMLMNVGTYRRILSLELKEKSKGLPFLFFLLFSN